MIFIAYSQRYDKPLIIMYVQKAKFIKHFSLKEYTRRVTALRVFYDMAHRAQPAESLRKKRFLMFLLAFSPLF